MKVAMHGAHRHALAALLLGSTTLSPAHAALSCNAVPRSGVNVAGGEFNAGQIPGTYARDYVYPSATEFALLARLHLKSIRVPILWERLQPEAERALDATELGRIDAVVGAARAQGVEVVLDLHNYGSYRGAKLASGSGLLPDLWKRLALHYSDAPGVVFGLMNEPNGIGVDEWAAIAKATLASIRATGSSNIVLVPGTNWDGAHSWMSAASGHSNAEALLPLAARDPHVVFEVHQYVDNDFSGTAVTCGAAGRAIAAVRSVGAWARTHRVRMMLGEFGVSKRPECVKALDEMLGAIEADADVWHGWTYWAAGAWWGDYPFNVQASDGATPQGEVLRSRADALDGISCTGAK